MNGAEREVHRGGVEKVRTAGGGGGRSEGWQRAVGRAARAHGEAAGQGEEARAAELGEGSGEVLQQALAAGGRLCRALGSERSAGTRRAAWPATAAARSAAPGSASRRDPAVALGPSHAAASLCRCSCSLAEPVNGQAPSLRPQAALEGLRAAPWSPDVERQEAA